MRSSVRGGQGSGASSSPRRTFQVEELAPDAERPAVLDPPVEAGQVLGHGFVGNDLQAWEPLDLEGLQSFEGLVRGVVVDQQVEGPADVLLLDSPKFCGGSLGATVGSRYSYRGPSFAIRGSATAPQLANPASTLTRSNRIYIYHFPGTERTKALNYKEEGFCLGVWELIKKPLKF